MSDKIIIDSNNADDDAADTNGFDDDVMMGAFIGYHFHK